MLPPCSALSALFFLLFINCPLRAQEPSNTSFVFRHITTEDGLAGNNVRSIIQDHRGYIWIATDNGVQRYDGSGFITFHHDPGNPQSLSSDDAENLLEDKEEHIWVSELFSGFDLLDELDWKINRTSSLNNKLSKELDASYSCSIDNKGNIWLLTSHLFVKYDVKQHQYVSHVYEKVLPPQFKPNFLGILFDSFRNCLWILDAKYGICRYDIRSNIFYYHGNNPEQLPIFNIPVANTIYLDRENNLWIHSYNGYFARYNLISRNITAYQIYKNTDDWTRLIDHAKIITKTPVFVSCILEDSHGATWFGAQHKGLLRYNPFNDSFSVFPINKQDPNGLHYNENINCIFEDREGNIWIGTDKGINIFNPYRQRFFLYSNDPFHKFSYRDNETLNFLQTRRGDIWVASWQGGALIFDSLLHPRKLLMNQPGNPNSLPEPTNMVWSLLENDSGKVVIGCQSGLLSIYDPVTGRFINSQPQGIDKKTIGNMTPDGNGNIWMSLYPGIGRWDLKKKSFTHYTNFINYREQPKSAVCDILVDKQGKLWVATVNLGLQEFDPAKGKFIRRFVPSLNYLNTISSSWVTSLVPVNDSIIAIGTGTGGVNLFNKYTEQFTWITTTNGLPGNNITALYFQPPNDLWVAATAGLCRINLQTRRITHFGPENGIINNDFSSFHFYKLHNGNLLVGYNGGFLRFNPDSIPDKDPPPDVAITGMKVHEQPVLIDSILHHSDTVYLSYRQNFITIYFSSPSYLGTNRINYYYQLEGVNKRWVSVGYQRFASFTNLPGGNYLFKVRCENMDGIPSRHLTSFFLFITPPYWQTGWFKALLLVALALFLYALYRYRISQILKLQAVRNEISKDLHDDVGATLSSIRILSEMARNKIGEGEPAQSYSMLSKISNYSVEAVEKMSDIVWAINPKNATMENLLQRLRNSLIDSCVSRDIQLDIRAGDGLEEIPLSILIRKNTYLVCKEAVNNALKHADCSNIAVRFLTHQHGLEVQISDDGNGFDPRMDYSGNGLVNMKSRAMEMKGSLSVHSVPGNTLITLHLPIP